MMKKESILGGPGWVRCVCTGTHERPKASNERRHTHGHRAPGAAWGGATQGAPRPLWAQGRPWVPWDTQGLQLSRIHI